MYNEDAYDGLSNFDYDDLYEKDYSSIDISKEIDNLDDIVFDDYEY